MSMWFQHKKLVEFREDGTIPGVLSAYETKKRPFNLKKKNVEELAKLLGKLHQDYNELFMNEPPGPMKDLLQKGRERYSNYSRKCEFVLENWNRL